MQRVAPVVERQLILFAVEGELAVGDAIGEATDESPHRRLARANLIDAFITERDVTELAFTVGDHNLLDLGAQIDDLHDHAVLVPDRVKPDPLAVDLRLKPRRIEHERTLLRGFSRRQYRAAWERDDGASRETPSQPFHGIPRSRFLPAMPIVAECRQPRGPRPIGRNRPPSTCRTPRGWNPARPRRP